MRAGKAREAALRRAAQTVAATVAAAHAINKRAVRVADMVKVQLPRTVSRLLPSTATDSLATSTSIVDSAESKRHRALICVFFNFCDKLTGW